MEFDIKGFFDNVDHSKLIKQLWSLNIRDKELLYVIRRILKAPILMPDGHIEHPAKGTPQGGIISPLLANVVLNELDHWIESQWQCNGKLLLQGKCDGLSDTKPCVSGNAEYKVERNVYRQICG